MPKKALIVYCILAATMIGSALTVVSRPAYSRYNELSAELEKKLEDQKHHFDNEVLASISNIVIQASYLASENIRLTTELNKKGFLDIESVSTPTMSLKPLSFDSLKIHPLADYEYSYARICDREIETVRLGDWRYKVGDTFLGFKITHISADCTILDDGTTFVPEKLYRRIKDNDLKSSLIIASKEGGSNG